MVKASNNERCFINNAVKSNLINKNNSGKAP